MSVRFGGVGLHSGEPCSVAVHLDPSAPGLVFVSPVGRFLASAAAVRSTELCTTLQSGPARVATVEHLLAALAGLGHFRAILEVQGPEIPILDGSAAPFADALPDAEERIEPLAPTQPFELELGQAKARVEPDAGLSVDYAIAFPGTAIGEQRLSLRLDPDSFRTQIAPARTFASAALVEEMRRRGLIRGGSADCALVFGSERLLNPPLRFPDEPVRHKILDLLGDLALLGRPLQARLSIQRGGHALHAALVRELLRQAGTGSAASGRATRASPTLHVGTRSGVSGT
jgi:UDP-3-O-[3-hydroxymyristoyl] N-acetylglucosamine deacetylase